MVRVGVGCDWGSCVGFVVVVCGWAVFVWARGVLNGKKKVFRFPKKARGHSMCSTMVGGSWRLAVGGWRLAAVGGGWQLATGGWWRLVGVGGGWWRLAVDGSWRLAVGGPLGRSLRAVLSKKKKSRPLRTPLVWALNGVCVREFNFVCVNHVPDLFVCDSCESTGRVGGVGGVGRQQNLPSPILAVQRAQQQSRGMNVWRAASGRDLQSGR